jgi:hypothetical protein
MIGCRLRGRHALSLAGAVLAAAGVLYGVEGEASAGADERVMAESSQADSRPTLAGRWRMTFRTVSNRGFGSPAVGSRRTRTWVFDRQCEDGACRVVARRETSTGFISLPVNRTGSLYLVTWRTRAPCASGTARTRPYRERLTFVVDDSQAVDGVTYAASIEGRLIGRSPAQCGSRKGRAVDRITGTRTDLPEVGEG